MIIITIIIIMKSILTRHFTSLLGDTQFKTTDQNSMKIIDNYHRFGEGSRSMVFHRLGDKQPSPIPVLFGARAPCF